MRRYEQTPKGFKAELIDGVVYVASPVRADVHSDPVGRLITWLNVYRSRHPHLRSGTDGTVLLPNGGRVQPDAFLFKPDGGARLGDDGYVHGVPELVCEVGASAASVDANAKATLYAEAGVPEYLLWRTADRPAPRLDWFYLQDGLYHPIEPTGDDVLESRHFPGLRLARTALMTGDLAEVLRVVSG